MNHVYYNHFRLGDCLWQCHWLRKAALANPGHTFDFFCSADHHWQLAEVVEDLPQIHLCDITTYRGGGINCWINAAGEYPPKDGDMINFLTHVYDRVAQQSGFENPIKARAQWLFDYPALNTAAKEACDVLIVNSVPLSGQFRPGRDGLAQIAMLIPEGELVCMTSPNHHEFSVTEWGRMSKAAKIIIMISTGPSWPTFNAVTEANVKERIILISDKVRLKYGRDWPHFDSVEGAEKYLSEKGLI